MRARFGIFSLGLIVQPSLSRARVDHARISPHPVRKTLTTRARTLRDNEDILPSRVAVDASQERFRMLS